MSILLTILAGKPMATTPDGKELITRPPDPTRPNCICPLSDSLYSFGHDPTCTSLRQQTIVRAANCDIHPHTNQSPQTEFAGIQAGRPVIHLASQNFQVVISQRGDPGLPNYLKT